MHACTSWGGGKGGEGGGGEGAVGGGWGGVLIFMCMVIVHEAARWLFREGFDSVCDRHQSNRHLPWWRLK